MLTMLKKDFWYDLPKELIAQEPASPRDAARLMVLSQKDDSIRHKVFRDLPEFLEPGDLLVVNNSKVLPARIVGVKQPTGAVCELLLLRQVKGDQWECLAKPGKRMQPGTKVSFGDGSLTAIVDETLEESEARALQTQIESTENVADCTFVSRTEARDAYVEKYDDGGVYGDLDATVFRHRFVIHVTDPNRIMETKTAVDNIPGIDKARADEAVANGFTTVRNVAGVISVALIAILLLVSVFIISNTIKLTTFDRRDEIAIMKMVGATNGFIRWPFVYEGLLLGLFSAVIAFGLQWGLYAAVAQGIANSDSLQILNVVPFTRIWQFVALVFLGTGILVGVGGSLTAIRRFLRV